MRKMEIKNGDVVSLGIGDSFSWIGHPRTNIHFSRVIGENEIYACWKGTYGFI